MMETSSPSANLQVDALENVQGLLAGAVVLVDVVQLDQLSATGSVFSMCAPD